MTKTVISVEHLTKQYDLGLISTGTLGRDLSRWWARVRKQPDPFRRVDNSNPFADRPGESILALDDVSFNVEQGQALGIIGRNGAGKSTLLKILSRVTAPTSGMVKVKGRIGSLLEVGTGFHPELTGRENVFLNGAILGMRKAEVQRKFDEIVDFSGVEKFIDTPVKRYSSGMYVRLAFAVAAHLDPEILIVDEVLAVGDAEFQKKCLGKMGDVTGEGRTVLFVSHNMAAIQSLCERAILLQKGKKILDGLANELVSTYLSSSDHNREIEIGDRKDRGGSGKAIINRVNIKLREDTNSNVLLSGQKIAFIFQVTSWKEGYILRFTVYDEFESPIISFDSSVQSPADQFQTFSSQLIECEIFQFSLSPGSYYINTALFDSSELIDHVERAFYFSVEEGYSNGRKITKNRLSKFAMNHAWHIPKYY